MPTPKPRLLDLFSGAGGAAKGYQRSGFYVVGVDIKPQPHYCGDEFHQADALTYPLDGFDVIHASPPCQAYTVLRALRNDRKHPDLIGLVRKRLMASDLFYVIENVPGAPMQGLGITLCGSMFGLKTLDGSGELRRHRHFEANFHLWAPASCNHSLPAVPCYGGGGTASTRSRHTFREHHRKEAMRINWMTRYELSQAIPPVYTTYIGKQLLEAL